MTTPTKRQIQAALEVTRAIAETIRELKEVPSGQLYAHVMGSMSLHQYEQIINALVNAGLVERTDSHLLRWIEPTPLTMKKGHS